MPFRSSSVVAAEIAAYGMASASLCPDGSVPVRIVLMKSASLHFGTIAVRFGPAGGPNWLAVPPPKSGPWQARQPIISTRYLPYSAVAALGGALTGCVVGGCALVGNKPAPIRSAPIVFKFVGGVSCATGGCERRNATSACTSPSLILWN